MMQKSTSSIRDECLSIIKVLPKYHMEQHPYFDFITQNNDTARGNPIRVNAIQEWLMIECIVRFDELQWQVMRNYDILYNETSMNDGNDESVIAQNRMNHSRLIILDLDETLLDQRVSRRGYIRLTDEKHWKRLLAEISIMRNTKDLKFGLRKFNQKAYSIIFRPYLMEFMSKHRGNSNFLIYSMAEPVTVIYCVILMEMYYNFAYRLTNPKVDDHALFQFSHIITRMNGEGTKSLSTVIQLIDDFVDDWTQFDDIYIIDDLGDKVWTQDIPKEFEFTNTNFHAFEPPQFEIGKYDKTLHQLTLFAMEEQWRNYDKYLKSLSRLIEPTKLKSTRRKSRDQLLWIPQDASDAALRMKVQECLDFLNS